MAVASAENITSPFRALTEPLTQSLPFTQRNWCRNLSIPFNVQPKGQ